MSATLTLEVIPNLKCYTYKSWLTQHHEDSESCKTSWCAHNRPML